MALKKLPNKFTDAELLKALETEDERDIILDGHNDVLPFLSHYNIEPGENKVSKRIIYQLYKAWSEEPLSRVGFGGEIHKYIPNEHSAYMLLNFKAIEVGYKTFELIQESKYDKRKNPNHRAHFEKFLNTFNIKKGNMWIEGFVLFYLYDKWTFETKKQHYIGKKNFSAFLELYLPKKRVGSSKMKWFTVDQSILKHLPNIDSIRKGYYEKTKEKRKAKNKKKQEQISRFRSKFKYQD